LPPSPLLHEETLTFLRNRKNLLAFSGGGDSTALFFLLEQANIPFDIVLVNYQTRAQSDDEERYAKTLASRFRKRYFIFTCKLSSSNFEHRARYERYGCCETLMRYYGYDTLVTAHHLGDRLEWFLMQLSKGAGLVEMLGMHAYEERKAYMLVRPLLHLTKAALEHFLDKRGVEYFHDASNDDTSVLRNRIRHTFATPFLGLNEEGIAQSFAYLEADAKRLLPKGSKRFGDLFICDRNADDLINIRRVDKALKCLGKVLSKAERDEVLRTKDCVVGGRLAVVFDESKIYVAPFLKTVMPKSFKETCRKARIPLKIRAYLFTSELNPSSLH